MSEKPPPPLPAAARVILSVVLPIAGAYLFTLVANGSAVLGGSDQGQVALQLAGAGLVSWFLGLFWYGLKGLGLRGGRPLFAGIGFAVLGWVAFLSVRFVTVEVGSYGAPSSNQAFVFLLLFEAFSVQLWVFGLFFRCVADWRGPLTAAVSAGILFGAIALMFFQEAFVSTGASWLYFTIWGVLYGIIRLRTGSLLGVVVVQAINSWTGWQLMVPPRQPGIDQLRNLYLVSSALYLAIIWRLWPKREADYRV